MVKLYDDITKSIWGIKFILYGDVKVAQIKLKLNLLGEAVKMLEVNTPIIKTYEMTNYKIAKYGNCTQNGSNHL